ncbi:MAG: tellurite resistance protein [Myxococcota bacterium]|jgi:tellurite resistance protein
MFSRTLGRRGAILSPMSQFVFGMHPIPRLLGEGSFECPNCRQNAGYEHTETRRWFAIGVPLVPLQRLGDWIRCTTCNSTFSPDVLERPPVDSSAFRGAVLQAMVAMMTVDGWIDDSEIQVLRDVYLRVVREELDESAVRKEIAAAETKETPLEDALTQARAELNAAEKELVVQAAYRVAMADGTFAREEKNLLRRVALSLGYNEQWMRNFLSATSPAPRDRIL